MMGVKGAVGATGPRGPGKNSAAAAALEDEASALQDSFVMEHKSLDTAHSRLTVVSVVLIVWGVVVTLAVVVLMIVAFSRLRHNRLFDTEWPAKPSAVDDWRTDAESGRAPSVAAADEPVATASDVEGARVHQQRSSTILESDMEPEDLPVDMSRLSKLCHDEVTRAAAGNQSEDELNAREIPHFRQPAQQTTS